MASHLIIERDETIFKNQGSKVGKQWFVRVSCNFFEPRIYGPFIAEEAAERFREGAEFELRKLLDGQLQNLSSEFLIPSHGIKL